MTAGSAPLQPVLPPAQIMVGRVSHTRLSPLGHTFRYPVIFLEIELDAGPEVAAQSAGFFGWNRWRPLSIRESDHLPGRPGATLRERFLNYLQEQAPADLVERIATIRLVSAPRWLGYSFNPVSFYTCLDADGAPVCHAAEVNNTFYETHLYLLGEAQRKSGDQEIENGGKNPGGFSYSSPKQFHVSPFNDMGGDYHFRFSSPGPDLRFSVDLHKEGKPFLLANISGRGVPATASAFYGHALRWMLLAWVTFPRICWQAALLKFRKGLRVYTKPEPSSEMTIRLDNRPALLDRIAYGLVRGHLKNIKFGSLSLTLPDRSLIEFRGEEPGPEASLFIADWRFFRRVMLSGDIGFGEAFVDGDWDTPDLPTVIELFARNNEALNDRNIVTSWLGRAANTLIHWTRRNTVGNSRKNIMAHYDLGNEFYSQWLDPSMTYSCGIYPDKDSPLDEAQTQKIHAMIEKADIQPDHHVLEIGCGWGAFAIETVKRTGCRVTGITVSEQQAEWARRRIAEEGLSDRIEILLMDYRKVTGQYDRIVSIEMLEAVGDAFLGKFFSTCDRLLKPGGRVALQVITIPCQRFVAYKNSCDWIQKHIFPGGMLPSLTRMGEAIRDHSKFVVTHAEDIGLHYARTLRDWRQRFHQGVQQGLHPGLDERFTRSWDYYLCYCEAGFSSRVIHTLQLVLTRPL
jgi:cyclopropane-fatty-acyl-phospholipid synthase